MIKLKILLISCTLFYFGRSSAQKVDTLHLDTLWQIAGIQQVLKLNKKPTRSIRIINLQQQYIIRSEAYQEIAITHLQQLPFDLNTGYYRDVIVSGSSKKDNHLELDIYTTEFEPTQFPSIRLHIVAIFKKKGKQYIFKEIQHSQWD